MRDKNPPLKELTSRKLKWKGQKTKMHPRDGENMHSFLECSPLLMEGIPGSYLLPGPGDKSGLRLNFSIQSLTGKSTLENKYHLSRVVQPSDIFVQVRLKVRMEGHAGMWVNSDVRQMFCCADRIDGILQPWQLPYIPSDKNCI